MKGNDRMKTLVNFRDAGGYATLDGTVVKKGKIFRSGEIVQLAADDYRAFTETYGIKQIFDLRGSSELSERPDDQFEGVDYINIDIMKDSKGQSASLEDMTSGKALSANDKMLGIYHDMILTDSAKLGYKKYLEMLGANDDPFIFHCFAGKDRTGIAAALLLGVLNVSKEDIYHDFLRTNTLRKSANDQMLAELIKKGVPENQLAEIETLMTVKKEYLDQAFEIMETQFGSLLGFVKDGLGISDNLVAKLKTLYTV